MKENDKRGAPRVPHISEVVCEGAGTRLTARTIDLSASGVFIHSRLCCEAGLILKLQFSVGSTDIETIGEVCYSMPQIGMGVRFMDLKPEYRTAIERLIESQRAHEESQNVKAQSRSIIATGVEPVDKLLGGLDRGHLYLAHGEASGKSLFGLQFLIEGLKNGQTAALISAYSTEKVVRRFARLGYDCLEDLRSGGLVTFKYPHNVDEQVFELPHLGPLLRELEPILDEASPERVVFDPVNNLLAGEEQGDIAARANQFAVWIRSFGATVVLVANEGNSEVIESLTRSVKESFRFEVKETRDRVVRYIAFEKSPSIPDQSVRVDPSRGISMLENQQTDEPPDEELDMILQTSTGLDASGADFSTASSSGHGDFNIDTQSTLLATGSEEPQDAFFAMLDELQSFASSLDPEVAETDNHHPAALGS